MRFKWSVRIVWCFSVLSVLMFFCICRIYLLATSNSIKNAAAENGYTETVGILRKSIFDCNMLRLTNSKTEIMAAVNPSPHAIAAISSVLEGEKLNNALTLLNSGRPAVVTVPKFIDCDGITCFETYEHTNENMIAPHLIGYLDREGHGVSGVEAAYDSDLFCNSWVRVNFPTDSFGNILGGASPEIITDFGIVSSGVVLTIDSEIQSSVEEIMKKVQCGAAVVEEIGTGKIRAMVSVPNFNAKNVSAFLESEDSPLLNRALSAYNVGSVFKPCLAAAAIDGGFGNYKYTCTGKSEVNGNVFKCHNLSGHGETDLEHAIAFSCNTFFYNLALNFGGEKLYNTASSLNFGSSLDLGGIYTAGGKITNKEKLENDNNSLVNAAIGQGEILLSPVSMLTVYEAIANGGVYSYPTVIEGYAQNGELETYGVERAKTRVMSKETAEILKRYLNSVVEFGTGTAAKPKLCTAAGKTATAETGWRKNGELIQNSWFCGFFPLEDPKYVVCVLVEDEKRSAISGAPIFSEIADEITSLIKQRD